MERKEKKRQTTGYSAEFTVKFYQAFKEQNPNLIQILPQNRKRNAQLIL